MKTNYTREEVQEIWNAARKIKKNAGIEPYLYFEHNSLSDHEKSKEVNYPPGIISFKSHTGVVLTQQGSEYNIWVSGFVRHKADIWSVKKQFRRGFGYWR